MEPERIKAIRESLGLTQPEAGKIIGGGPRAFTKYEAGTTKPAQAIISILKILEADPKALDHLRGDAHKSVKPRKLSPFEVSGEHIEKLNARQLVQLTKKLLTLEAASNELPADGIHVAENITTPDGGEDARIEWNGAVERTKHLKGRLNQFQMKSGTLGIAESGKEVLTKDREIKGMVRSALENDGYYTLLCSKNYVQKEIQKRENSIIEALSIAGLAVSTEKVSFYDASKIADWVNSYASIAIWVLEIADTNAIGAFHSWENWSKDTDHKHPFAKDERFESLLISVLAIASQPQATKRIVGLSGVGKSRLLLEAFREGASDPSESSLRDLILYARADIADLPSLKRATQDLADASIRAVLIVDRCDASTHSDLEALTQREDSKLSLLTVDDQPLPEDNDKSIVIPRAPASVIEKIVEQIAPGIPSEDFQRLANYSEGFPRIATLLTNSWLEGSHKPTTSQQLAESIIVGREVKEANTILRGAQIISTFRLIYDSDVAAVASLGRDLNEKSLRFAIRNLERRGIIQRKGQALVIQPIPVALTLAEHTWTEWGEENWDDILFKDITTHLRKKACEQLALLNTRELGLKVAKHLLRLGGPLSSLESISDNSKARALELLTEVDCEAAISLLEYNTRDLEIDDFKSISGDSRRSIVGSLEKICFRADTFERGAHLLFKFAAGENEGWSNNATGQFTGLFPAQLGDTAANGETRLRVIDDLLKNTEDKHLPIVLDAIKEGAKTGYFSRAVGPEIHGFRPTLEPWLPKTWGDFWDYIKDFHYRLIDLSRRTDEIGLKARQELGHNFRSLAQYGLLDVIAKAIKETSPIHGTYWPEGLQSLGHFFAYDAKGPKYEDSIDEVRSLFDKLQPSNLDEKLSCLVLEMSWHYPFDEKLQYAEQQKRQASAIEALVQDLLKDHDALKSSINSINYLPPERRQGQQRNSGLFGRALCRQNDKQDHWLNEIIESLIKIDEQDRDYGLISGYTEELEKSSPDTIERFKEQIAQNADFVHSFPFICSYIGAKASDLTLAIETLNRGMLLPLNFLNWSYGGVLKEIQPKEIAPFIDCLLGHPKDGPGVALNLIGMYCHGRSEILNELLPQVTKLIERTPNNKLGQIDDHLFEVITSWFLKKGREDKDATEIAIALSRQIADDLDDKIEHHLKPIIPLLIENFPEVSWQIIGQSIASDEMTRWRAQHLLGKSCSFSDGKGAPILKLPEDILFAWCEAYPDTAPRFIASSVPVLTSRDPNDENRTIQPWISKLIDKYGSDSSVLDCISSNIGTFGWTGSRADYYALYEGPIKELENHPIKEVRFWAVKTLKGIREQISQAKDEDAAMNAHYIS